MANSEYTPNCEKFDSLEESALLVEANAAKLRDWVNGDEVSEVNLGGKQTPTIRKLVHDIDERESNAAKAIIEQGVTDITAIKDDAVAQATALKEAAITETTQIKNEAVANITSIKTETLAAAAELKNQTISETQTLTETCIGTVTNVKNSFVNLADRANATYEKLSTITATASSLPEGAAALASYDPAANVFSFEIPAGATGQTGPPGPQGQAPVADVIDCGGAFGVRLSVIDGGTATTAWR